MMKRTLLLSLLSICLIPIHSKGQIKEIEFGKITQAEMDMALYEKDPEAEAIILFDNGLSEFIRVTKTGNRESFDIKHTRTKRIKIFKKEGYHYADIAIPYYTDGYGKTEKVDKIKAIAYNIENGQLVKTELDKKNVFTEKINEYWSRKSFAIPNVKEGTVIEYTYEHQTPFKFNLPDWQFQDRIPTLYSAYECRLIPFWHYSYLVQGVTKFNYQNSFISKSLKRRFGSVDFNDYIHQFVLEDIPAFKDESYITSIDDYITKIDFQLATSYNLDGIRNDIITTWAELNTTFLGHEKFGKYMKSCEKSANKILEERLDLDGLNDVQKSQTIVTYVKDNFRWNGSNYHFSSKKTKELLADKSGNSADLNLFLLSLFKAAGFETKPVVLSTRSHGKIPVDHPFEHFINYVVCMVKLSNGYVLLDATNSYVPFNSLPSKCLNGMGLIVEKKKESWVRLNDNSKSSIITNLNLQLNDSDETIEIEVVQQSMGYDASKFRRDYQSDSTVIINTFSKRGYETVSDIHVLHEDKLNLPYTLGLNISAVTERYGNMLAIAPFADFPMNENRLKQEERKYPVDLIYKKKREYQSILNIPKGYLAAELPSDYFIDDDLIKIEYKTNATDVTLKVKGKVEFKKSVYPPEDYKKLKTHISKMVDLFNEKVILKKS